jgi:hypothetical protein
MASPIVRATLIAVVLAVATAALVGFAMLRSFGETCEVCITFHGRSECRGASGTTREEALRTAINNTCAFLASGMTEVVSCTNTPPTRSSCDSDAP